MAYKIVRRGGSLTLQGSGVRQALALPADDDGMALAGQLVERLNEGEDVWVKPTMDDAIKQYRDRPEGIADTEDRYLGRLSAEIGTVPLRKMSTRFIDEYVTKPRLDAGLKPGSVRRELNVLGAVLKRAYLLDMTEKLILCLKPSVDDAKTVWLDGEMRDKFLAACSDEFRPLATFLFFTGARLGEATGATVYDVMDGAVRFVSKKGVGSRKRSRLVPLHPRVAEAMLKRPLDCEVLLPNPQGKAWSRTEVYREWRAARRRCGAPKEVTPHTARHTFGSLLVQRGVDTRKVAELLGHSTMQMTKRYSHMAVRHLVDAVAVL